LVDYEWWTYDDDDDDDDEKTTATTTATTRACVNYDVRTCRTCMLLECNDDESFQTRRRVLSFEPS
tara:strand:- start:1460 stop:1657 length:198 start_codon:yes stop_codon:yes gene_type:complete